MRFLCTKLNGIWTFSKPDAWNKFRSALADGEYYLSVEKPVKKRSNAQNRYIWGVVVKILFDETGQWDTPGECYEWIKRTFNPIEKEIFGKLEIVGQSIAETSTSEFERITQLVRVWSLKELNIIIPEPNECN